MATNRHIVFEELNRLVAEYDDCQRGDNHWNVDDALSDLIIRLNGETRRVRKQQQLTGTEVVCNGT